MRLIDADVLLDKFDMTMRTLVKSTTHENIELEALSLLCGAKLISDAPTILPDVRCKDDTESLIRKDDNRL